MSKPVKYYLAAYNLVAFIFWLLYLLSFLSAGLELNSSSLLLLNIAQGLAVLEIVHALLKWVKSPIASTVAQVASRLLVLVLINVFVKNPSLTPVVSMGVIICSFAWSITELVRYSFYFLSLFNRQPGFLLWMRYTFFIALYPLGVTGEWLILAAPLIINGLSFSAYIIFYYQWPFLFRVYHFPVSSAAILRLLLPYPLQIHVETAPPQA
jgi:very-long-chain (3R)-3-hydroxyacyl-CoA dehydratase